jgi:hypothetical protein
MLTMQGDFAAAEGAYRQGFGLLDSLALFADIRTAELTDLEFNTWPEGRQGETHLFIGDTDVEASLPQVWSTEGVEKRPARIQLMIVSGLKPAQLLETLAHEWCLHGTKNWQFIQAMRKLDDPEKIEDLSREMLGTATTVTDVIEHRQLAEGTHQPFIQTMVALKGLRSDLAAGLLKAWQDDIDINKASARPGHLAIASWPGS